MLTCVNQGTSVIMYRTAELRQHQYYVNPSWPGEFVHSYLLVLCLRKSIQVVSTLAQACLVLGESNNVFARNCYLTFFLGDRPGALIAGCWAVMQHMGTE